MHIMLSEQVNPISIAKPEPFKLTGVSQEMFYKSKDLQAYDPAFYYGCKTRPRNILVKKEVPATDYIYANFNARERSWVLSTDECKKALLLISKTWVETKMASMKNECVFDIIKTGKKEIGEPIAPDVITDLPKPEKRESTSKEIGENITTLIQNIKHAVSENIPSIIENKKIITEQVLPSESGGKERINSPVQTEYEAAPPLLYLDEKEMFRDADGNVLEIETRGTDRREDAVFFRCSDVSKAFDMPNLNKNITQSIGGYEENTDYKYFNPHRSLIKGAITNKRNEEEPLRIEKNPFALYLTYEGLLRVLFVSRNKHATPFRKWATAVLFTHQMGTKDAKEKLGTDLLNINLKTYSAVFGTYASTFPCIYLLRLASVKDVRETFGIDPSIPDDLVVYKYGFTKDFTQRFKEHSKGYGKMPGVALTLSTFHVIDQKYTVEAEGDVREMVETFNKRLHLDGHNELVVLTDKEMNYMKKQYTGIGSRYAGATAELTTQIAELKARIKELENQIITERLTHENEIQKEQYEKKLVEMQRDQAKMQRDLGAELFKAKEANYMSRETNYNLEIQLIKQSGKTSM